MKSRYPSVLSIAGSDPSGGAGLQADLKAVSACGAYAMTAITAVIDQDTRGVRAIEPVSAEMVRAQVRSTLDDIGADVIKIGLLPNREIMEVVAEELSGRSVPVVLDPVMVATSGDSLMEQAALEIFKNKVLPLATLLTPNIPEAEALGLEPRKKTPFSVLYKGGHGEGKTLTDTLYDHKTGELTEYVYPRIETRNTHGTGCTLSSAIAAFMARGMETKRAVEEAEAYLHKAIEAGKDYEVGHGHGPVNHFFL